MSMCVDVRARSQFVRKRPICRDGVPCCVSPPLTARGATNRRHATCSRSISPTHPRVRAESGRQQQLPNVTPSGRGPRFFIHNRGWTLEALVTATASSCTAPMAT